MHRGPENAGGVVHVAIGLDIDDDAIARFRRQARAHGCGRAVTHAAGALPAQVAIRLVVLPKLYVVAAGETAGGGEAPVFVHDQRPELGVNAGRADR